MLTLLMTLMLVGTAHADVPPNSSPELVPAVRTQVHDVTRCVGKAHKKGRMPQGPLLMGVTVAGERPDDVRIEDDDTGSRGFASCVRRKMKLWVYPGVPDGDYTWQFTARRGNVHD